VRREEKARGKREENRVRVGGGAVGITKMALMGCRSSCGGEPVASSIAVIPSDLVFNNFNLSSIIRD